MKFMILIHQGTTPLPGTPEWEALSAEQQQGVYAAYQEVNQTPGFTPGERMSSPDKARTVRVADGKAMVTDGPFAETKEALGGYAFFEGELEAAAELAARIPAASMGGAVEVRPIEG